MFGDTVAGVVAVVFGVVGSFFTFVFVVVCIVVSSAIVAVVGNPPIAGCPPCVGMLLYTGWCVGVVVVVVVVVGKNPGLVVVAAGLWWCAGEVVVGVVVVVVGPNNRPMALGDC